MDIALCAQALSLGYSAASVGGPGIGVPGTQHFVDRRHRWVHSAILEVLLADLILTHISYSGASPLLVTP